MEEKEAKKVFENYTTAIKTLSLLQALEEKDKEIKMLKKEVRATNQVHEYDVKMIDDVKGKAVELYNEIEEKDKIIDLMAEELTPEGCKNCIFVGTEDCCNLYEPCQDGIKQYFENKAKGVDFDPFEKGQANG